jgi:hypothetical protein
MKACFMGKEFKHPLARRAKVWVAQDRDRGERNLLVVVTTLVLDAAHKSFNSESIARLKGAIGEFMAETPEIAGYVMINRLKDWDS